MNHLNLPKSIVPSLFLIMVLFISCHQKRKIQTAYIAKNDTIQGKVIKIIDGDTYDILLEGNTQLRIRMEGIDAPEKGMPYYKVAKNFLKDKCILQQVKVQVTGTDNHGRKLGYTYLEDGTELSREMLKAGLAWHFIKYNTDPELAALQMQAQEQKFGIWSQPNPMTPWQNRRLHRLGISTKDSFK
jgi:endonuclease YncB( thermonuclease family)